MLLQALLALCLVTVPLAGGRLVRLADLRPRRPWAVFAALGLQAVFIAVDLPPGGWLGPTLHLASYGLAAVFVVSNRRVPGLALLALGAAMNVAAIAANGGVMPASARALRAAGLGATGEYENSAALDHPRLAFLGDVSAWPEPWPLANVFSPGDVLVVLGAGVAVHCLGGSRLGRWGQRRRGAPTPA